MLNGRHSSHPMLFTSKCQHHAETLHVAQAWQAFWLPLPCLLQLQCQCCAETMLSALMAGPHFTCSVSIAVTTSTSRRTSEKCCCTASRA